MPTAFLADRALVSVSGPDAEHLLQNVVTTDLASLADGEAKPGALLSPQGKILFDFLIARHGAEGFLLECRQDIGDDLVRRLTLYRLRANARISKLDQSVVQVRWNADSSHSDADSSTSPSESAQAETGESFQWLADRRFDGGVERRAAASAPADAGDIAGWHAFRVAQGIAESGHDYALGDAFPHDVLLDQAGGVGFGKGCYVGQEVVSRMQHRGTARRRAVVATAALPLPGPGADVTAAGRTIGTLGSPAGGKAIALVRLDKAKAAMDAGEEIAAQGVPLTLAIPAWVRFGWPETASAEGA